MVLNGTWNKPSIKWPFGKYIAMDESNAVVSAYTMYRHLQQYCSYPSICTTVMNNRKRQTWTEQNGKKTAFVFGM